MDLQILPAWHLAPLEQAVRLAVAGEGNALDQANGMNVVSFSLASGLCLCDVNMRIVGYVDQSGLLVVVR